MPGGRKQLQFFEKQEKLTVGLNEICLFAKKSTFNRPKRVSVDIALITTTNTSLDGEN